MKNRALLITFVIAILLGLAACSDNGQEYIHNTKNPSSTDNTNSTDNTDSPASTDSNVLLHDQEWVWIGPRNKQGALSEDGYYYVDPTNKKLSYADLTGKGSIILCTTIGCKHNSSQCDAHLSTSPFSPIFFWNEHLYYVDDIHTKALLRRDAAGLKLLEIGKVGEKYIEMKYNAAEEFNQNLNISWEINSYLQAEEYMYYCAQLEVTALIDKDEPNVFRTYSIGSYIGRIHLSTGKDEVLAEQISEKIGVNFLLCAASEDGVLFLSSNGVDASPEDESFVEESRQMPITLNYWSEKTGEIKQVFTKCKKDFSELQLVADGKVYYTTQGNNDINYMGDLYAYDLKTGTDTLVAENAYYLHYGGGYAMRRSPDKEGYTLCNLKTGEILPQELEGAKPIRAYSNDGCVLQGFFNEVIKNEDGSEDVLMKSVTYYVAYASLADGLQESDLVQLYTQIMGFS